MIVLRYFRSLSVRTRIAVLALIPVAGFGAIGWTYLASEREVAAAFDSAKSSGTLARASLEFKLALAIMKASAQEMAAHASKDITETFHGAHSLATQSLETIRASAGSEELPDISALEDHVPRLKTAFDELSKAREDLGFTEFDGMRGRSRRATSAVDQLINRTMSERPESDNKQLLFPLVILRRLDAEFRSGGKQSVHWTFLDEYKKLNAIIDTMTNASKVKGEVGTPVKAYADAFEGWIASANKVAYFGPVIIEESKVMATPADRIIASADERTGRASSMLASSQAKNRNIIVAVSTDTELLDRPWHHSAAPPAHQRHGSARCRRL